MHFVMTTKFETGLHYKKFNDSINKICSDSIQHTIPLVSHITDHKTNLSHCILRAVCINLKPY